MALSSVAIHGDGLAVSFGGCRHLQKLKEHGIIDRKVESSIFIDLLQIFKKLHKISCRVLVRTSWLIMAKLYI